jgi:hypothetical protein
MSRTLIIGDVHGCRAELEDLLGKVGFGASDRLFFVGDLVARGPDSEGVVALARKLGAKLVRGNHEDKLLQWRATRKAGLVAEPLNDVHRRVVREMKRELWEYLSLAPLWLDLLEHDVRLVHAGVAPGVPIEFQARKTLLTVRSLGAEGEPLERPGMTLWASSYTGSPHIVFGHNARGEPQIHPWATGIDTGCVYGGALTAVVLNAGERMPPAEERRSVLVSVTARRRYFRGSRRSLHERR